MLLFISFPRIYWTCESWIRYFQ